MRRFIIFALLSIMLFSLTTVSAGFAAPAVVDRASSYKDVTVRFSEPMDMESLRDALAVTIHVPGVGYGRVAGRVELDESGTEAVFRSSSGLIPGMNYSLEITGAKSAGGLELEADEWSFETETITETIYELAINKVKEGKTADFKVARANFIAEMKKEDGVGIDGAFQSFFTTAADINPEDVTVGITKWASADAFDKAVEHLMPLEVTQKYFETFDQLAYLLLKPEDGKSFDLNTLLEDAQVMEFAVRKTKDDKKDVFAEKRKALFDKIAGYEGYVFDREFVAVDGSTNAVVIVWESMKDFQNAAEIFQLPEFGDFMSIVDVQTYQATQVAVPINVTIMERGGVKVHTYLSDALQATHIIETENSLVLVDAQFMAPSAVEFRNYADSLSKPIERVIISHTHPDHFFGLGAAFEDVEDRIYALEGVRQFIEESGPGMLEEMRPMLGDAAPEKIVVPGQTLEPGTEIIDGVTYEFERYTDGEAAEQLVIRLPGLNTLILQDLERPPSVHGQQHL